MLETIMKNQNNINKNIFFFRVKNCINSLKMVYLKKKFYWHKMTNVIYEYLGRVIINPLF